MPVQAELKPCPAGHVGARASYDDEFEAWYVDCPDLGCTWRTWGNTEAYAVAAWHDRITTEQRPAAHKPGCSLEGVDPELSSCCCFRTPAAEAGLVADLKGLRAHHAFTRDRIGQPGCEVRKVAAEYVEIIDRTLAALKEGSTDEPL